MTDHRTAWNVLRWHTNREVNWTRDDVGRHSERVADLIRRYNPAPSQALIDAALAHDDGEWWVGDMPWPAKQRMPAFVREWFDEEETHGRKIVHGHDPLARITRGETRWLKFADRLDAYVWARCHGADMTTREWTEARRLIVRQIDDLILDEAKHEDAMLYLDRGSI